MRNQASQTLYVSDLDGTLLQPDATLSASCRRRLAALIEQGVLFTVATARSIVSAREILGELPLRLPIIEFNGAYLSEFPSGRHIDTASIDRDAVARAYELILEHDQTPFVACNDGVADRNYYERAGSAAMQWYLDDRKKAQDTRLTVIEDLRRVLENPVVCLTLMDRPERLAPLELALREALDGQVRMHYYQNMYDPEHWWLTLHPGQATKATAVRRLIEVCGLAPEEIVVFGDHENDLPMFELADRAYAVGNAVEALKAQATGVLGPNTAASVVEFIERECAAAGSSSSGV